jgi:hypothetical protein
MFLVQIPSKSGCHKFPCHDERKDIWKSFPNIFTFSCIHCSMTRRIITTSYALFWLFVHSPNTFCYPSNSICNCKTPMSMLCFKPVVCNLKMPKKIVSLSSLPCYSPFRHYFFSSRREDSRKVFANQECIFSSCRFSSCNCFSR